MAASMGQSDEQETCKILATVAPGFEEIAKDEIKEKFDVDSTSKRGNIFFIIPIPSVKKILELQSVENLFVLIKEIDNFGFLKNKKEDLEKLIQQIPTANWELGLSVWRQFFTMKQTVSPLPVTGWEQRFQQYEYWLLPSTDSKRHSAEASSPAKIAEKKEVDPKLPSFRATCYRTGSDHSFQSPDAAHKFGGAIQDYFFWNVDLKNHDIEVVLTVDSDHGHISIALTKVSLHQRHLTAYGLTTLKPTLAYNMVRMCKIQDNDIVCDPMCGGGSIPIEAAVNWPKAKHICGDMHEKAVPRCYTNVHSLNAARTQQNKPAIDVDMFRWDTTRLPLKGHSIDVFVSDIPFGKRSGSHRINQHLYPAVLGEMARCSKPGTGRACLLTQDKRCFTKSLSMVKSYWSVASVVGINIGGLAACVWLLSRSQVPYTRVSTQTHDPCDKTRV